MPYRELILRVKAAKAATGITYKEIEDKTRKIGTPVSESSIKRIFAEGSENKMTRNDKTLMPIASVLLAPEIIKDALQPKKETPEESLDIIAMKDDRIDVLKHQMAAKETEYLEKIADLNRQLEKKDEAQKAKDEDHKALVDVLNRQISMMEASSKERIAYLKEKVAQREKVIKTRNIILGILLFFIVIALVIDTVHHHFDWLSAEYSTVILGAVVVLGASLHLLTILRKK